MRNTTISSRIHNSISHTTHVMLFWFVFVLLSISISISIGSSNSFVLALI